MRGRHIGATISSPLPGPKKEAENQQSLRRDGPWPPTVLPLCILRAAAGPFRGGLMRDRYMGLPDAGRAEDHQVLGVLDEVTGAQRLDLLLVEGGLVAEVEALQALDEGEAGQLSAHADVLGGLGGDLLGEDLVEEVGIGNLPGGGVLEQRLEPLAALEQPQALQVLLEALELGGAHAGTSPAEKARAVEAPGWSRTRGAAISVCPTRASYSARSRISTIGAGLPADRADPVDRRDRAVRAMAPGPCSGSIRT